MAILPVRLPNTWRFIHSLPLVFDQVDSPIFILPRQVQLGHRIDNKGLYPGYIIFFVQSALMIAGSKVLYRWQQAIPQKMGLLRNILTFTNFAYTVLVLNYSCIGFMVLSMHETLSAYGSVYFIGTIIPITLIFLGNIIKPAKATRHKARKEQ